MAPRNKREASKEPKEEVCKRLKEEAKVPNKGDQKEETDIVDEEQHNNNNVTDNNSNGSVKGSLEEKSESTKPAEQDVKKEDVATKDTQVNGSKKAESAPEKDSDTKKASKVLNGEQKQEKEPEDEKTAATKQTSTTSTSADKVESENKEDEDVEEEGDEEEEKKGDENVGTLLICGGANWEMTGRKELPKNAKKPAADTDSVARNLWAPARVVLKGSDKALRVKGVFSGCNACHSVIVTEEGITMTFGRNDKGQLGLGDTDTRLVPTVVEVLKGIDIVAAACGRSHTLFLTSDGIVLACGDNKMGQCGTNQQAVHTITTPTRIAFKENKQVVKVACGAEFSMITDDDGKLYSFGHPEHGQLGHNSEGKYFTSGNKYAFHCEYAPRRIVTFIEKSREGHVSPVSDVFITDIACGTNHTLAVDKKGRCFSWGFAGYHRLGHSETKNELVPRSIKIFDAPNNSDRGAARVFAGATHSMALDVNGLLYFWGQNKSSGEATMYPKNVQDLCGWKVKFVACANRSIFVVADETCISWGPSPTYGELGYGDGKAKSSTTPVEVRTLDNVHVLGLACGFGHTMLIARDSSSEEQALLKKNFKGWPIAS